jgi:hypothetical protein
VNVCLLRKSECLAKADWLKAEWFGQLPSFNRIRHRKSVHLGEPRASEAGAQDRESEAEAGDDGKATRDSAWQRQILSLQAEAGMISGATESTISVWVGVSPGIIRTVRKTWSGRRGVVKWSLRHGGANTALLKVLKLRSISCESRGRPGTRKTRVAPLPLTGPDANRENSASDVVIIC